MTHGSALVASGHVRAAPLSVRARTLSGLSIGSSVRIIGLRGTSATVGCRHRCASRVGPCVRVVTSPSCCRSVRPISSLFPPIVSCGGVILRHWIMITITPVVGATVRRGIRIVVTAVTVWLRPVATAIGKDRTHGRTQNERA